MQKGHIYIVSTGVGNVGQLTQNALKALEKSDMIVGYTKYISDISPIIEGKEIYSTGMTQEVEVKPAVDALNLEEIFIVMNANHEDLTPAGSED